MYTQHYENPLTDTMFITREEFRNKYLEFVDHNDFTEHLRKEGKPVEMIVLDQIKNTLLFSEFESALFGKENE